MISISLIMYWIDDQEKLKIMEMKNNLIKWVFIIL